MFPVSSAGQMYPRESERVWELSWDARLFELLILTEHVHHEKYIICPGDSTMSFYNLPGMCDLQGA